ncbi:DnaT-like ssDNA-binding protein [Alysiella crassa]|uniref:Putative DnaT-like domain-containing protein n=1 Tax=Alysiella crassa TaxID=153491 RepID=A0A376BW37_9NEIS|nr:DnaT-like ssDNA-binding protein [Alysiella crassa]UOP06518.1 hypothetical protein LVJ80_12280 [Alysiella crassa]SSY81051.1 Uncharacterised protein [Alysiella crassa]
MNSYATMAQADEFHAIRPTAQTWAALSNTEKQARLVAASDYIDLNFRFRGKKSDGNQMRQFPRNGQPMPPQLVWAVSLLAVSGSLNAVVSSSGGATAINSVKIGELQVSYQQAQSSNTIEDGILQAIKGWLWDWLLQDKRMGAILVSRYRINDF